VRLDALFGTRDADFDDERRALHYAMARELCRWLDAHGHLWPFYVAWRDNVKGDVSGAKAFSRVVGATPAEATPGWIAWVRDH
jgi:hypothetical protein